MHAGMLELRVFCPIDERGRTIKNAGEHSNGAQGRNRTTDTAIFSRMLYQLSYLGVLQERGQSPSSGRFIVGSGRPVHPRFAFGFAGLGPAVHKVRPSCHRLRAARRLHL